MLFSIRAFHLCSAARRFLAQQKMLRCKRRVSPMRWRGVAARRRQIAVFHGASREAPRCFQIAPHVWPYNAALRPATTVFEWKAARFLRHAMTASPEDEKSRLIYSARYAERRRKRYVKRFFVISPEPDERHTVRPTNASDIHDGAACRFFTLRAAMMSSIMLILSPAAAHAKACAANSAARYARADCRAIFASCRSSEARWRDMAPSRRRQCAHLIKTMLRRKRVQRFHHFICLIGLRRLRGTAAPRRQRGDARRRRWRSLLRLRAPQRAAVRQSVAMRRRDARCLMIIMPFIRLFAYAPPPCLPRWFTVR